MQILAIYFPVAVGMIVALALTLGASRSAADRKRARERNLAEAKMNARLLRLNL